MTEMNDYKKAAEITEKIINRSGEFDCIYFDYSLIKKSEDESLSIEVKRLLEIVALIASYRSNPDDSNSPYLTGVTHSIVSALDDSQIESVKRLLPFLHLSVLRARINDVVWLVSRNPDYAKNAVHDFLECSQKYFDLDNWTFCTAYIERALQLAVKFRRKDSSLALSVANAIQNWIDEYTEQDNGYLTEKSIRLMLDFNYGDPSNLLDKAKNAAKKASSIGNAVHLR